MSEENKIPETATADFKLPKRQVTCIFYDDCDHDMSKCKYGLNESSIDNICYRANRQLKMAEYARQMAKLEKYKDGKQPKMDEHSAVYEKLNNIAKDIMTLTPADFDILKELVDEQFDFAETTTTPKQIESLAKFNSDVLVKFRDIYDFIAARMEQSKQKNNG